MAEACGLRVGRPLLLLALVTSLAGCGGGGDGAQPADSGGATATESGAGGCERVAQPEAKPDGGQKPPKQALDPRRTYDLRVITNCGRFTIRLDQKQAPKTAASLVALAHAGFFDGLTFHRVVPGFVIQGGDPTGTGSGGPGYKTVDVPPANAQYVRGVVAMAKSRQEAPGTAGSQFFVVTRADAGLPPEYAVVGKVTTGLGTVLAIDALGVGDGAPSMPVVIKRVVLEDS
jgi:peptidyl-prolyl cis-trans isomerase B (cyclophilin B)